MSDVEGHDITGGTENHTMWLTCSCGTWRVEEVYEACASAPAGSPYSIVAVMGRLADAGRDHIVEVTRKQEATEKRPRTHPTGLIAMPVQRAQCVPECTWLQTRQHAEGCTS